MIAAPRRFNRPALTHYGEGTKLFRNCPAASGHIWPLSPPIAANNMKNCSSWPFFDVAKHGGVPLFDGK